MRNTRLEIRLLSGAGGAEISGVDVAQDLDDETIGEIRDALNEHCVVFFRNQQLDVARHKAFARRFGEIFIHPNYVGMGDDPEIVMVRREPGDTGGELECRLVGVVAEDVVRRERPQLRPHGVGDLDAAVPDVGEPEPGRRVDVLVALDVLDDRAVPLHDHERLGRPRGVVERVNEM